MTALRWKSAEELCEELDVHAARFGAVTAVRPLPPTPSAVLKATADGATPSADVRHRRALCDRRDIQVLQLLLQKKDSPFSVGEVRADQNAFVVSFEDAHTINVFISESGQPSFVDAMGRAVHHESLGALNADITNSALQHLDRRAGTLRGVARTIGC